MRNLLQRLIKVTAYLAAALIIVLAVAVGLFRLLLPRLPEYQEEIKGWANQAIGMQVEFSGMNARWRLSGPELNFYNAELAMPGEDGGMFAADEVRIGVDLTRLLLDQALIVNRIVVRDSAVSVKRDEAGDWLVQDVALATLAARFPRQPGGSEVALIAEDFAVSYRHGQDGIPLQFVIDSLRLTRRASGSEIDADLALPPALGSRLLVGATGRPGAGAEDRVWQYTVDGRNLNLAGWSDLQPAGWPALEAGSADLSLAVEQSGNRLTNAVADFRLEDLAVADGAGPFSAEARLEFEQDGSGWLLAADDLQLRTSRGSWPAATLALHGASDRDGDLDSLTVRAGYLQLDDLEYLQPWLPTDWQDELRRFGPSGRVLDLDVDLAELNSEAPRYDLSLTLQNAGFVASDDLPGVRDFSGSVRANHSGGRIEIDASGMQVDMARWLDRPVTLDSAQGTVVWRQNRDGIVVLSDSIRLQNQDLTSRSSVQLSVPAGDASPVLDLESRWSIYDLSAAREYLPARLMNPGLYRWLSGALLAGRVPAGTTRFSGPVEKFPFDGGQGIFRIEAELENATLRYSELWPDVENLDLNLIIDRTRLYSTENTAVNAGNSVTNAKIEIADLRDPVLTIDAFATGTLESIREFSRQSPIANVFGGHLDRVDVAGDAAFNLKLNYPILRRLDYSFETRIQTSNGTVRIDGLEPPITELNGVVSITRDSIEAESLAGRFLGEPVTIGLRRAGEQRPGYSVIADVDGRFSAAGLSQSFGPVLQRVLGGAERYTARIDFPRGNSAPGEAAPLRIAIDSTLQDATVDLPAPLGKARGEPREMAAVIEFPQSGRIETRGSLAGNLRWSLRFLNDGSGWDFDRGVLAAGGKIPERAGTRGLHIVGNTPVVEVHDWLNVAVGGRAIGAPKVAERIRSLDLAVEDLYVLGQHFEDHRVQADRSSNDWIVRLDGPQARGVVTIPYDFFSGRRIALEMERLILPGSDDEDGDSTIRTDPRTVPGLSISAEEFAFGERHLGAVDADFSRTADGLIANEFRTEDPGFTIRGSAGWVVDTSEPSGQRTWVTATLNSSNIERTMRRLNSRPGIEGDDMEIGFDVRWAGGPRQDFLASLDGTVDVRLGSGQLDEVEPGAGRMFGLLSVVALPRRLSLDFRDVFDKGFAFDEITGRFRIEDGDAFTCDLSLKGPAADVGIVGRAGLAALDYRQTAVVSANVGNTLPVVGAVVAGPQVAAALLIFSQIFKKPLQEMGQVYYAIGGSWQDPDVTSTDARRFAEVSREAGCLDSAG